MKLAFYTYNEYEALIPNKLIELGYDVTINKYREDADLVIAMSRTPFIRAYIDYRHKNNHTVPIINNVLDIPEWRLKDKKFKGSLEEYKHELKSSNYVTTISNFTSSQLKRIWNIDSEKVFNHFNNEQIEKVPEQKKENQIISIGRFVPEKRFHLVIEALSKIPKLERPKYLIIGKGDKKQFYDYANKLKVKDFEVRTDVPYEEVYIELKKSKLCVCPSIFEGLGLVPKEAIWCNTVPLICDLPVMNEFHKEALWMLPDQIDELTYYIKNYNKAKDLIDLDVAKKEIECCTVEKVAKQAIKYFERILK